MLVSVLVLVVEPQPAYAAPPAAPAANTLAVSADGTKVSMTFTQDLHPNIALASQFQVTIGTYAAPTTRTVDVPVIDVTRTTARIITLTLDGVIDHNKPPPVAYTAPPNVAGTDNVPDSGWPLAMAIVVLLVMRRRLTRTIVGMSGRGERVA
jgi:hypothetical protein